MEQRKPVMRVALDRTTHRDSDGWEVGVKTSAPDEAQFVVHAFVSCSPTPWRQAETPPQPFARCAYCHRYSESTVCDGCGAPLDLSDRVVLR